MAKRSMIEQLDEAVQAILAIPKEQLPQADARVAPLLRVAAQLRDLPRESFKARLKADLERKTSMTTTVNPIREGFHTLTPYVSVREVNQVIDFVKQVFGAEGQIYGTGSEGGIHSEYRVGESMVMIGGGEAWRGTPRPAALHVYVKDADAAYERALQAGAVPIRPPQDQEYGDREGSVKDVAGNHWYIGTNQSTGHAPAGMRSVTPVLHPKGAADLIDFLKRAFGAEEIERYASPEGVIHHAKIKIGDSLLEMGEAHAEFQPMPTTFYLYVEDTDALYQRAVEAGGQSLSTPADQPYGDRTAAVADPFGNYWYIATHIRDIKTQ